MSLFPLSAVALVTVLPTPINKCFSQISQTALRGVCRQGSLPAVLGFRWLPSIDISRVVDLQKFSEPARTAESGFPRASSIRPIRRCLKAAPPTVIKRTLPRRRPIALALLASAPRG